MGQEEVSVLLIRDTILQRSPYFRGLVVNRGKN